MNFLDGHWYFFYCNGDVRVSVPGPEQNGCYYKYVEDGGSAMFVESVIGNGCKARRPCLVIHKEYKSFEMKSM